VKENTMANSSRWTEVKDECPAPSDQIAVVGGWLAIDQAPETTIGPFGEPVTTGGGAGHAFGLIGFGVGSVLVSVATIGWGVSLGVRAARRYP
jgi:hypothetical protein